MKSAENWREATIEEVKSIQLDVLRYVRDFCQENDIHFFLMYGTLLGAARHKGYIPWDDDVDICMLKENYYRFVQLFNEKQNRYRVFDRSIDKDFPYYFAKIAFTDSRLYEIVDGKPVNLGINIDLFLMDRIPSDAKRQEKLFKKVYGIRRKMIANTIDTTVKRVWYKQLILHLMQMIPHKKTADYCWDIQHVVEAYEKYDSSCVFEMMTPYGKKSALPEKYFSSTAELEFEGENFPVPAEYHAVLRQLYGDYKTPPPVEKQVTHHSYKAYVCAEKNA